MEFAQVDHLDIWLVLVIRSGDIWIIFALFRAELFMLESGELAPTFLEMFRVTHTQILKLTKKVVSYEKLGSWLSYRKC